MQAVIIRSNDGTVQAVLAYEGSINMDAYLENFLRHVGGLEGLPKDPSEATRLFVRWLTSGDEPDLNFRNLQHGSWEAPLLSSTKYGAILRAWPHAEGTLAVVRTDGAGPNLGYPYDLVFYHDVAQDDGIVVGGEKTFQTAVRAAQVWMHENPRGYPKTRLRDAP